MAVKMEELILNFKGWVNGWIEIVFTGSYSRMLPELSGPKSLAEPRAGLIVMFGIGIVAINFSCQDSFAHTCATSLIRNHPPTSFAQHAFCVNNYPHDGRTGQESTALKRTQLEEYFSIKRRPFGEEHGDFGV